MKKMFTRGLSLSITLLLFLATANAQFPTIYASLGTGQWATTTTWETFTNSGNNIPGAQGTGTPAASAPSGTHHIYIRSGHTVTMGANRNMMGLTIEAGGTLACGGTFTLKPGNGGTGFTGPNNVTITNNGTLGISGDVITLEVPIAAGNVTITGSGTSLIGRLRIVGNNPNNPVVTIDQDLTFNYPNNYGLSAIYNPQATDNYTINLNSGKKLTFGTSNYFGTNSIGSGGGFGTYTYNMNGTLDFSASAQTMQYLTGISPTGGTVNLNLNGPVITGAAFNSSPVAPGIANINVSNGVVVDATLATVMNFNGNAFQMTGNGSLKRTVPGTPGVRREFPVGIGGSYNPLRISSESGPDEVYTVGLTNVPVVPPPAKTLPRAWGIAESTPGGNIDTLWFSWTTADEGSSGFVSTDAVYVGGWNGSTWVMIPATKSGTGSLADPYVARVVGTFVSTAYILTNSATTPVTLVNMKASKQAGGVKIEFANETELDVKEYVIEKSADGRNFITLTTLLPKTNNGSLNSYAYADINPYRGNNSYRIKAIEKNGNVKYSIIISLNLDRTATNVNVYPNPVKGNTISVQLENISKGVYTVVLYNGVGQKVFTKQMKHDGNTSTLVTTLPPSVKTGIYRLQVGNGSNQYLRNIIVE